MLDIVIGTWVIAVKKYKTSFLYEADLPESDRQFSGIPRMSEVFMALCFLFCFILEMFMVHGPAGTSFSD